jgi:hypothetical protein
MGIPGFTSEAAFRTRQHNLVVLAAPAVCLYGQTFGECYEDCANACHDAVAGHLQACLSACRASCAACPPPIQPPPPPPIQPPPPPPLSPARTYTATEQSATNCVASQDVIGECDPQDFYCFEGEPRLGPGGSCECVKTEINCPMTTCTHWDGPCTGFTLAFWRPAPTRCITGAGLLQCCNSWDQYPWVKQCADGSVTRGCGFC